MTPLTSYGEEICQDLFAMTGQSGLRMELYALDGILFVPYAHHLASVGLRRDVQTLRHGFPTDHERMVARRLEGIRQVAKDPLSTVMDHGSLAMHDAAVADHLAAKRRPDALMSQADAKNGSFARKPTDQWHADSGLIGSTRPRRNQNPF